MIRRHRPWNPSRHTALRGAPVAVVFAVFAALAVLVGGWLLASPMPAAAGDTSGDGVAGADEKALEVAERTLEAMGGREAWDATRFLSFEFFGVRTHHWDRHEGRHRLEGTTREGDEYVVLLDLSSNSQSREGRAFLNGEELEGEAAAEWLERAWGAWVNDTYWLSMPYKLRDPGVILAHVGEEEIDGRPHDVLKLTFEGVGLTPGDTYWAYFDRETGLMSRWAYHLEGWEEEREPTAWDWLDWQEYGDVMLSPRRRKVDDGDERSLAPIRVYDELPDSVFTSPEPVESAE